ncbi:hypothetical protein DLAC_11243 [Tieghemostelium lacteum]|uniref:DUF2421 domain-containing protein n=1 Tax=Tieghemostelium lacteum TaxID=361077 RepID=A0A151Z3I4_TIELA|nr:hypothetical protein DLAC_11243 [Tieghemostelium lacteum]|eukprot:KYQ88520.1 hypothetical protein DLAC_11243 [Tieghemostelium lacteum]
MILDESDSKPLIFKDYQKLKRRYIGLRTKVALKEALGCVILAVILLFVPLGDMDLNILTLAPVIYVMVSFSISSFISIFNGAVLVWSGLISAVYIAILSKIMEYGDSMIWISFVLNFVFTFILYSLMPGKRWMNLFGCKMVLINITVVVYFNYGFSRYALIQEVLIVMALIFACLLFCGIFVFPWLSTRLFARKVIKTLDTIKLLFKAVGNQIQLTRDQRESLDTTGTTYTFNDMGNGIPMQNIHLPSPTNINGILKKFNKEIYRLNVLLGECRVERWNSTLTGHYESLLAHLTVSQKQLISMKLAIDEGFSKTNRDTIITPMVPVIESLVQQVSLQITIFIEILLNQQTYTETEDQDDQFYGHDDGQSQASFYSSDTAGGSSTIEHKIHVAKSSFKLTIHLIDKAREFYKTLIVDKSNDHQVLDESQKLNYFITGLFEFSLHQKNVLKIVLDIKKHTRTGPIALELLQYGIWFLIMSFPMFLRKRFGTLQRSGLTGLLPESGKWDLRKWVYITFFMNGKWHFPLQVSIGFVATNIIFHFYDLRTYNELTVHGLWTVITTIIVFQPSLGSTLTRSIHRTIGTLLGGLAGYFISWITTLVDWGPGKEIILLIGTFLWVVAVSHVQQDPMYSYAGSVSALTFLLISYSQYFSKDYEFMYAVLRLFFIVLGIIAVLVISLLFFPFFTYKDTRSKMYKNISTSITTFCKILQNHLPLHQRTSIEGASTSDSAHYMEIDERGRKNTYGHDLRKGIRIGNSRKSQGSGLSQKDINSAIKGIRVLNGQIYGSLVDVKSEFLFKPSKYSKYLQCYQQLTDLHTYLVSADTMFSFPFRDKVLVELQPTFTPLQELIESLQNYSQQFQVLVNNPTPGQLPINRPSDIMIHMKSLEIALRRVRESLITRGELYNTYPDFVQYSASIYNINNLLNCLVQVMEHLIEITS